MAMHAGGFPISFLSEDISLAEFFYLVSCAKSLRQRDDVPTPLGIYAFDLKSSMDDELTAIGPGFSPKRLLLCGTTPGAMKKLEQLGALRLRDPSGRPGQDITLHFNDGSRCFVELFAEVARANRPVLGLQPRNREDESVIGVVAIVREYAVAAAMRHLGIERWRLHLLPGWAAHNRGRPMPLMRILPGVSRSQLRDEVRREAVLRPHLAAPPANFGLCRLCARAFGRAAPP